ncbi:MAG: hypothetical protein NTX58_15650, partial [Actinobacteria bacterium]|nr:hypothetical protein [Actinomycetota bacterium]
TYCRFSAPNAMLSESSVISRRVDPAHDERRLILFFGGLIGFSVVVSPAPLLRGYSNPGGLLRPRSARLGSNRWRASSPGVRPSAAGPSRHAVSAVARDDPSRANLSAARVKASCAAS